MINLDFLNKTGTTNFKRKDINFFEIKKDTGKSTSSDLVLLLIPLGMVCIMAGIYGFNTIHLNTVESNFTKAENKLKSFDLKTKQPILEKYTLTRDVLATYNTWVGSLNGELRYYKTVKPEILDDIINQTNGLVECKDITVKNNSIEFVGVAYSLSDISEFQAKCEKLDGMKDVFVHSAQKSTVEKAKSKTGRSYDEYEFLMSAKFESFANESAPTESAAPTNSAAPKK